MTDSDEPRQYESHTEIYKNEQHKAESAFMMRKRIIEVLIILNRYTIHAKR